MSFEPQLQQHRHYMSIRVHNEDDIQKLYPLILDYIREPNLASSVKEFVFCCHLRWDDSYLIGADQSEGLGGEENARDISQEHGILQVLTDLGLEEPVRSEWVRVLTWMKPELIAAREETLGGNPFHENARFYSYRDRLFAHYASALLLMLCPNIEKIEYEEGSWIVDDMLRRNNYGLLPKLHLEKLREVILLPTTHFTLGDPRYYIYLDILRMLQLFHRLPAIESVTTDGVGQNYNGGPLRRFPPATSNVKRIHVGHSMYGGDVIWSLIRAPKLLEEITLTTGGHLTTDGGFSPVSAKTIGQALAIHKASLRKVDIDLDRCLFETGYDECDEEEEEEELETEDEWLNRYHDAPFRLAEALPKSLEYLTIRGYTRGSVVQYDSQIDELLLTREVRLPLLKELHGINETIPSAAPIQ
ncbi:hypothetical protein F5B22DRAFT_639881 [Xylaria bambusicola]|uniref:uncharacterized protein n=1 Tax=Xylaria bambusicola TaxID=326684 RepID=UPI002007C300|nr:uncharacterized protein F5B22DRAFT_639881 [Xylaria bambusicola]KAI0505509.1 hypothetical protein F5B22DRAFT_639881 [Xylaria bambusicola]